MSSVKVALADLVRSGHQFDVVIHSLDQALYQATVVLEEGERLLLGSDLRPLRFHSLQAMREALAPLRVGKLTLRQQSAYDEMIGQPLREGSNVMEVPLAALTTPPDDKGRAR
jgi:hypothetical protein